MPLLNKNLKIISAVFFLVFFVSFFVFAQRKLEIEYPEIGGLRPETVETPLPDYIKYIFNFVVLASGLIIFGVLIYSGILYLTSSGKPEKQKEAKERLSSGFLGIIILLTSYIILTTINPQLVFFHLFEISPPPENLCNSDADCEAWEECLFVTSTNRKECKERPLCQQDEDCPGFPDYVCKGQYQGTNKKFCVFEGGTLIVQEIPIGTFLKEKVLNQSVLNDIDATSTQLLDVIWPASSERDPNSEKRISNLNKKLKNLSEECNCSNLEPQCNDQYAIPLSQYCLGDSCKDKVDEIDNILKTNEEKINKLKEVKENFIREKDNLEKNFLEPYSVLLEQFTSNLKTNPYFFTYSNFSKLREKIKNILPKVVFDKDVSSTVRDIFTFYYGTGGSLFDTPPLPYGTPEEIKEIPHYPTLQPKEGFVPLSCGVRIPLTEIFMGIGETATRISILFENNISLIDELISKLEEMNALVTECKNQKCKTQCYCLPNFLIGFCCVTAIIGAPQPCCAYTCASAIGTCQPELINGREPCQRDKIASTTKEIADLEEEIISNINEIKENISKLQKFQGEEINGETISLKSLSEVFKFCPYYVGFEEKERVVQQLFSCPQIVAGVKEGNYHFGPDGAPITSCYIYDFYCCSIDREIFSNPPYSHLPSIYFQPSIFPAPEGETIVEPVPSENIKETPVFVYSSTSTLPQGNFFILKQGDPRWGSKTYGASPHCTTYAAAGCAPSSLAMVISYFQGYEVRVDEVGQKIVNKGLRPCNNGTYTTAIPAISEEYNLQVFSISSKKSEYFSQLQNCFNSGGLAIASMKGPSRFTTGGHYIVLGGIDKGDIIVLDSSHRPAPRKEPFEEVYKWQRVTWCLKQP